MLRRLISQALTLPVIVIVCSGIVDAQCWDIEQVFCSNLYPDFFCSETPCVDDACPANTTEHEGTNEFFDLGTSGHEYGYDGTVPAGPANFVYCIKQRDCINDCDIYGGENRCKNGDVDLFDDENAVEGAKKYNEVGDNFGCGYF